MMRFKSRSVQMAGQREDVFGNGGLGEKGLLYIYIPPSSSPERNFA